MTRNAVFHSAGSFDDGSPIAVFPSAITSVFGRTGVVAAAAGDYFGAMPAALTGATQAARFVGATTSGAPVSGTFAVGDVVVARDGKVWVCTSAGTPGTWVDVGGGASVSYATPAIVLGSAAAAGAASTVIRSDSTIAAFDATNPAALALGGAAAVGAAAFAARRDHAHAMPAASSIAGYELDYVEVTSNLTVTATTAAGAQTFITGSSVAYDGSTVVLIEFFAYALDVDTDGAIVINLWDGSTDLGRLCLWNPIASGATTGYMAGSVYTARRLTPSNASHQYLIKAWKTGGTAHAYAGAGGTDTPLPAFIRITKV